MSDRIPKHELPKDAQVYRLSAPCEAKVISNTPLHLPDSPDDLMHTVLDIRGTKYRYVEGQAAGVLPPGTREDGKPHKLRLYSIASASRGDDGKHETLTLCTKRVREPHRDDASTTFNGVCSNYICDLQPGDTVRLTGPVGKHFTLPVDDSTNVIMMAAGTGISPFRAFLRHIYEERQGWAGQLRLYYGVKTQKELMYMNATNDDLSRYEGQSNFKAYVARSREDQSTDGGKVYVQSRLRENAADVWQLVKDGHFVMYICGLKGMDTGIEEAMTQIAADNGADWPEMQDRFKKEGRWNVEVY